MKQRHVGWGNGDGLFFGFLQTLNLHFWLNSFCQLQSGLNEEMKIKKDGSNQRKEQYGSSILTRKKYVTNTKS